MTDTDIADGTYTAVLDRFEDDVAVLLVEDDDETAGDLAVQRERLPEEGRHADAAFEVVVRGGDLVDLAYRPGEGEARREDAQSRFDRLARRAPSDAGDESEKTANDGDDDGVT